MPDRPDLIALARDIVMGYLRRNPAPADQLPVVVVSTVYQALAGLGKEAEPAEAELIPAISIRRSFGRDFVICLDCGRKGKLLRRHVRTAHGLSVQQYRSRWNLPRTHPLIARGYSEYRSDAARQHGLGGRPRSTGETPAEAS